jgi:(4S)-4-hydroxy-5-phosphonooxypentane-2,3-dione isomerase
MIVTCVHVTVKSEKINEFIAATMQNHEQSVKEPGNLRFDFVQNAQEPDKFMLYEAYESESAAFEHKNTAHYLKWRDTVADWMAEPRTGVKYIILAPLKKEE